MKPIAKPGMKYTSRQMNQLRAPDGHRWENIGKLGHAPRWVVRRLAAEEAQG